jgi:hypothetical protein
MVTPLAPDLGFEKLILGISEVLRLQLRLPELEQCEEYC